MHRRVVLAAMRLLERSLNLTAHLGAMTVIQL